MSKKIPKAYKVLVLIFFVLYLIVLFPFAEEQFTGIEKFLFLIIVSLLSSMLASLLFYLPVSAIYKRLIKGKPEDRTIKPDPSRDAVKPEPENNISSREFYYDSSLGATPTVRSDSYPDSTLLTAECIRLKANISEKEREIERLNQIIEQLKKDISPDLKAAEQLKEQISALKKELIELDDEVLYQSVNLFEPKYDFASSEEYKDRLEQIRNRQKEMVKDKTAVSYFKDWTVNGSLSEGRKMTNDNIKMILRCFNTDCDNAINKVKYNNVDSTQSRIQKSFDTLNKLNEINKVSLSKDYLNLKFAELWLAVEYAFKKQDEKEEQKQIRQELREQAKLQKELEEARKNIVKEQQHYSNALTKLNTQLGSDLSEEQRNNLLEKKQEVEEQLQKLQESLENVDYRAANQKAGYVYIISNIGAFGENVYKIGMTRRLEPMDRVDELGDASVPFNFDVHAMIFSEDAPKLEAALHKAFEDKKLNMINTRREFFHVTLDEIEQVVKENYDKTVEFVKTPPAEQYRRSKAILEDIKKHSN